jgi:hypothetical protein
MQTDKKICKMCIWRWFCLLPCEEITESLNAAEVEIEKKIRDKD